MGDIGGNGYVITYGPEYIFNHGITSDVSITAIDSWKFVIAYQDRDNSYHGTAVVGDVSGTALSYGSEYVFNSVSTQILQSFGAARLSDDRFVMGYENTLNNDGRVRVGVVSGNTVSYGNQTSFNPGLNSGNVAVAGFGKQIAVCWQDESDGDRGKCRVGGGVDPTAVEVASFQSESGAVVPLGLAGLLILSLTGAAWTIRRRRQTI